RACPGLSVHALWQERRTSSLDMPTVTWLRLVSRQSIGPPHPDSKRRRRKTVDARPPIAASFGLDCSKPIGALANSCSSYDGDSDPPSLGNYSATATSSSNR